MNTKAKKLLLRKESLAALSTGHLEMVQGAAVYGKRTENTCPQMPGTVYGTAIGGACTQTSIGNLPSSSFGNPTPGSF